MVTVIGTADKAAYKNATTKLKGRLDPSRKALAVQDFRHLAYSKTEGVCG